MKRHWGWLLLLLCSPLVLAQDGMSAVTIKTMADGSQEIGRASCRERV